MTEMILDVKETRIDVSLKIPLKEMQFAVPYDVTNNLNLLLGQRGEEMKSYLLSHTSVYGADGSNWKVEIDSMRLDSAQQEATGMYAEWCVFMRFLVPSASDSRSFTLKYDAIVHQLVTHKIIVYVRQDFDAGKIDQAENEVGLIYARTSDNVVAPLTVSLGSGSVWKGFRSMIALGIEHIIEGADHMLFILVLLLCAPLSADYKKWTSSLPVNKSLMHVVKLITAFTIGHSVSLILGASQWLSFPQQPIEILIALSIFITAIHAIRPLFPKSEYLVAIGFGLVHGMAFSFALSSLELDLLRTSLSILGFNLGIELMQLVIVVVTLPWILLMAKTPVYANVRIVLASVFAVASLTWLMERITSESNFLSPIVNDLASHGKYFLLFLIVLTLGIRLFYAKKDKATTH